MRAERLDGTNWVGAVKCTAETFSVFRYPLYCAQRRRERVGSAANPRPFRDPAVTG
jgi:hypothetical protein